MSDTIPSNAPQTRGAKALSIALGTACLAYLVALIQSFNGEWFNPSFTGGDATQQLFPFYQAIAPDVFQGDLVFDSMKCYLAPLHWWIGYGTTILTQNPVMTGHWMMLYQFIVLATFLFLLVRHLASTPAAFIALIWFMHQDHLIGNIATGIPRGWIGPILMAFLYFLAKKNHVGVWLVIFVGCLLNALGAFVSSLCYGIFLILGLLDKEKRAQFKKPFLLACMLSPLLLITTMFALSRPQEIGKMVTLSEASKMEAFQRDGGRFPFLPMLSIQDEFKKNAFRSFVSKKAKIPREKRLLLIGGVVLILITLAIVGRLTRREILPREPLLLITAAFIAYLLSRALAFNLYVPARYLNWPFGIAWTVLLPVSLWRAKQAIGGTRLGLLLSAVLFSAVVAIVLTGTGLRIGKRGGLTSLNLDQKPAPPYNWIKKELPRTAVIASHPVFINALPLAAMRRAYITEETAHPFYDKYWREAERRTRISLEAFYAPTAQAFVKALGEEQIDYFVFPKHYFTRSASGEGISHKAFFRPFLGKARELTSRNPRDYFGEQILSAPNSVLARDAIVYRDENSVILNVNVLRRAVPEY